MCGYVKMNGQATQSVHTGFRHLVSRANSGLCPLKNWWTGKLGGRAK